MQIRKHLINFEKMWIEWFFIVFLTVRGVFAHQDLLGDNVCKVETTETLKETILVPITRTIRIEEWCLTNFPPRCFKYVNQTLNEPQIRERIVKGFKTVCCEGFIKQNDRCFENFTSLQETQTIQSHSTTTNEKIDTENRDSEEPQNKTQSVETIDKMVANIKHPEMEIDIEDISDNEEEIEQYRPVLDTRSDADDDSEDQITTKTNNNLSKGIKNGEDNKSFIGEAFTDLGDIVHVDYDRDMVKSHFEKSSNDDNKVEIHLTTSKNMLLGFVLMISFIILLTVFVVVFVSLKCLTVAKATNKTKQSSIFNVPLPDLPGNVENVYEPIKENQEVIALEKLAREKSKFNTLNTHFRTPKEFDGPKSPFFNTLPSPLRSVSYHGHANSKLKNTFEIINADQVAYDVPPESKRFSMVSYVDMEGSNPLYVNYIKRQEFSTFSNSQSIMKDCSSSNVVGGKNENARIYSNSELEPFLNGCTSSKPQDVLKNLPGFKNNVTTTQRNEAVTSFQEESS